MRQSVIFDSLFFCFLVVATLSILQQTVFVASQTTVVTTTTTSAGNSSNSSNTSDPNATSSNFTTTTTAASTLATNATANASENATTPAPNVTTTPAPTSVFVPAGPGPVDVRPIRNVSCPFSRWQGEPRYCFECRWCPFRSSTCCEMEDEIAVLKSVNVSGSTDWDCFITIVHFQQCGRCDPNSLRYLMNKSLNYVWDPRHVAIRPCKQACKYIHKQCKDAKTLAGEPVVPSGMDEVEFCQDYPELSTEEVPCFDSAGKLSSLIVVAVSVVTMILISML